MVIGNEPEIAQVEKFPSETLLLDETLNNKCHKNVDGKNKAGQKNKRQGSPKMKNQVSRKRKYSSSLDESDSDSDSDENSSLEHSDIGNGSSSESSKEENSQDEHTSSSSVQNNRWKFSKQLKKWTKDKFLKHISSQEIKESILENTQVPSNFLSWQKLDDYLLEVLLEAGKLDEIFSDRSMLKDRSFDQHNGSNGSPLVTLRSPRKRQ